MRPAHNKKFHRGSVLLTTLILTSLLFVAAVFAIRLVVDQNRLASQLYYKEQAFAAAEAGFEYYRWHLAHVPDDFTADTGVHDFKNAYGDVIGQYNLAVTPPSVGSSVVTITSTGYTTKKPNVKRVIVAQMGIPSFAKYAVVANADMRFGEGTEVFGPIHSNGGIRFDGLAHNLVTSAQPDYDDPDHSGNNEYGVHTHVNVPPATGINSAFRPLEAPPSALATRSDVFAAGRQVGIPAIDFNGITSDLATLKTKSLSGGIHLDASGAQGYHLTLRTDGKIDMRIVNSQLRCQYLSGGSWKDYGICSSNFNRTCTQNNQCNYCTGDDSLTCSNNSDCSSQGAGTCVTTGISCMQSSFSIGTRNGDETSFTYSGLSSLGYTLPANGIIFAEDDIWIDGQINGSRLTIVAAREPLASGSANIYLNKNLTYTNYDGTDVIGLISQQNILVGFFSANNLRVDGAFIAQNGRVGRAYYGAGFTSSTNNANFQLYPTGGQCVANPSRTCTINSDCTNYCQGNASRACTTTANCNNFCVGATSRSCTTTANCNNYCQVDTTKSCTTTGNCINYCASATTRTCTTNNLCNGYCQADPARGAQAVGDCINYCQGDRTRSCTSNNKCNGWCSNNHNRGCTVNGDCSGSGTCDMTAPDVGPCVTASTGPYVASSGGSCVTTNKGPCVTGDSCMTTDSCVTTDTCSSSHNPDGGTTCQEYRKRDLITTYGALGTNQRYGFAWIGTNLFSCGGGQYNDSGYCDRTLNFDSKLLYAPPPSFPTTGQYTLISFEEK